MLSVARILHIFAQHNNFKQDFLPFKSSYMKVGLADKLECILVGDGEVSDLLQSAYLVNCVNSKLMELSH